MNFMRKRPTSPIDDLTKLYNEAANKTIYNLALEEKGEFKRAVQGWKGLHTHILYQLDVINKSYSLHNYTADEISIREGIETLDKKGLDHFDRVNALFLESVTEIDQSSLVNPAASYSTPTLRNGSPHTFAIRHKQQQAAQPRLLKTLRSEKYSKFNSSGSLTKASEASKIAATATYKQPIRQNWTTSKSLGSHDDQEDEVNYINDDELDLFDKTFQDEDLIDFDVQSFRRNETLQQLEATGLQSRSSRSKTADRLSSQFESLDIDTPHSKRSFLSTSPTRINRSEADISTIPDEVRVPYMKKNPERPPIPKTKPLIPASSFKKPPAQTLSVKPALVKSKSASTTRLPTKPSLPSSSKGVSGIGSSSTSALRTTSSSKSSTEKLPNSTNRTVKKPVARPTVKPVPKIVVKPAPKPVLTKPASKATTKQPATSRPTNNKPAQKQASKPSSTRQLKKPQLNKSESRSRSESPLRDETKDTETINSESSGEFVDEMQLSEKEIQEKMEDQIIEKVRGIDYNAAKQIFNEIVVRGDEVHWDDIAGLETAKSSLKETVVYPFLRPDLFSGLREPARGMLLFGPPGTGKTMLARAVATESNSTFFSISASSLTSKYLGESEKLVRALFLLAKELSPAIIFVDEIDSLLSARNESGENESSRRIKNEFLIQWSDLTHAAAGRDNGEDLQRVLVLAATNLPWAIDEAARRRFVRRQYIPLPEPETRLAHIQKLLAHQKHTLDEADIERLVQLTDGFSGSDITALAKDAAMGPLRSLGDKLLSTARDEIRPIGLVDFEASLNYIRPSVSKENLSQFDDWAAKFGSSGV